MTTRSIVTLGLFALLALTLGGLAGAQAPEATDQDALPVAATEATSASSPESLNSSKPANDTAPLVSAEPRATAVAPGLEELAFGFPFCSSQAHCESICAPFGGICWRQHCICD